MALRIRVRKQDDKIIRKPYDIERLKDFIAKVPNGKNILITYKTVSAEGSEEELKDQYRKYYFSQVANPVADEASGGTQSGLVFHATMKSHFATVPSKIIEGMTTIRSVFSDSSDMDNKERWEFIKQVKALVRSLYPEWKFAPFDINDTE